LAAVDDVFTVALAAIGPVHGVLPGRLRAG
jgi:hypothetical protein